MRSMAEDAAFRADGAEALRIKIKIKIKEIRIGVSSKGQVEGGKIW